MDPTDAIDLDGFDTWLDQLARGIASPAPADAAELSQAAAWFHEKGQHNMASASFGRQLSSRLLPVTANRLESPSNPVRAFPSVPPGSAHTLPSPKRRALIAAASLLIAISIMVLVVGSFRNGSDDRTIPAPMNELAQSGTPTPCDVATPSTLKISGTPVHEAILFPNTNRPYPNSDRAGGPVIYQADLPTGPEASPDDLAAIQRTLAAFSACLYEHDLVTVGYLFSDDSYRRSDSDREDHLQSTVTPDPTLAWIPTPTDPLDALSAPVTPEILRSNVLEDGRIGVLLAQDLTGYGLQEYFILIDSDRGWLIDEEVKVTPESRPSPEASSLSMEIEAADLQFIPSNLQIPADVDFTIVVKNTGKARKTFVIPELNINEELPVGETISVVVNAPKGVYEFYSDVPGQKAAGMRGWLVAIPAN